MKLYDLKTNHERELLGLDKQPYFSWKMTSDEADTRQTAYQIRMKDRAGKEIWDSGKQETEQSCFVEYTGEELKSRMRYTWTVRVWDNHGNESSGETWFENAFLKKGNWAAEWVSCQAPAKKRKKGFGNQPAPVAFRRSITIDKKVKSARLYATCHGIYRLSINGLRPDDRDFAPEYSSYDKYLSYQTYDITSLLKEGENVIGMYVADGWYFCPVTTMSKNTAKQPYSILYQAEIIYEDGSKARFASDGSEKYREGTVLFADLFGGEKQDLRQDQEGWDQAGFDASGWKSVIPVKENRNCYDNLAAQIGAPVRVVKEVPAVRAYVSPKGEQIVDFGQVMAGRVCLHAEVPAGTEITLDHFEIPDVDGNYFSNIFGGAGVGSGIDQKVTFISDGRARAYEAMFSFQGFRYIRVSGLTEVKAEDFTAHALSTDKEELGTFTCSDGRLNRLYENTRWSQRSNMISIPTDCPQREKAGWTGDIGVYAPTSLLNEDTTNLLTRWMESVKMDQEEDGGIPMVVPNNATYRPLSKMMKLMGGGSPFGASTSPAGWSDACILVPMALYRQTGNTVILREQYETMKNWCDYIINTARTERGDKKIPKEVDQLLWNTGFHYGEWLIPSQNSAGYSLGGLKQQFADAKKYVPEIYAVISMRNMAEIAGLLGKSDDQTYYADMAEKMKDAFAKGCINPDGTMKVENMGAYIMPYYYDLVPEEKKAFFKETALKKIADNGGCLDTGFLGTPVILDTLCRMGETKAAYDMLFMTKAPSWLYEVEHGATTIWESWITTDEKNQPLAMSLNHYAFGCVDDWMFRTITGITPTAPGYKTFTVAPVMDDRLTSASRSYETEYGRIAVSWSKDPENGNFEMEVTVPCNTRACIQLPDGRVEEKGSGSWKF